MKFQNPSLNSVLNGRKDERTNGRRNGRTHKPKAICSPLFQSWGHKNYYNGLETSVRTCTHTFMTSYS